MDLSLVKIANSDGFKFRRVILTDAGWQGCDHRVGVGAEEEWDA